MEKKAYGTHDIARLCHVTPPTVGRWIEEGKIPSFVTAGGHRRVWDSDLAVFLKSLKMPVPEELGVKPPTILIVDDEESVRKFIKRVLRNVYGSEVAAEEAVDGFEAGKKMTELRPALVVLDVLLPGLDGERVCRMIRADDDLKGVKVLAISGINVDQTKKRMLAAGADDFLGKPFGVEDLEKKLRAFLPA